MCMMERGEISAGIGWIPRNQYYGLHDGVVGVGGGSLSNRGIHTSHLH
jgi:hypothetical protein